MEKEPEYTTESLGLDNTNFKKDIIISRMELVRHLEKLSNQMESINANLTKLIELFATTKEEVNARWNDMVNLGSQGQGKRRIKSNMDRR